MMRDMQVCKKFT